MPGSTSSNSSNCGFGTESKIIQISNVAPQANKEQMQTLFGYIGKVEDLRLYPALRDVSIPVQVRICFVKFAEASSVSVAQHISNTVFIDRALIVAPFIGSELPDELKGLEILNIAGNGYGGLSEPKLPPTLINQVEGVHPHQVIRTTDPRLAIHNLPPYPLLPSSTDSRRLEEIRRTLMIVNIDQSVSAQQVIEFFSSAGEVKYFRFCSRDTDILQYGLIEFVEQESIIPALKLNNKQLGDHIIKVHHSVQSIIKPPPQNKTNEAAQKEIEEAVNRVKEAQQSILTAVLTTDETEKEVEKEKDTKDKVKEKEAEKDFKVKDPKDKDVKDKESAKKSSRSRSKTRSRSRRRSSSRSRRRRSRSRNKRASRSRSRKRSRTRSKSRSRDRRKKSRSRSRDRRKRSKSRERRRRTRSRSRSRKSPRRSRDRRDRDRSKERSAKDKDKDKSTKESKSRDKDKKERDREKKDRDKEKDRERKEKKKDRKDKKERAKSPKESSEEKEPSDRGGSSRKSKSRSPSKSKSRRRSSRSGSRGRSR